MDPALVSLIVIFPALLMGLVFWHSIRTRRGVLFGVTVPLDLAEGTEARRIIRAYRTRITLLTVVCALASMPWVTQRMPWLTSGVGPVLVLGSIAFWQLARRQVAPYRVAVPLERSASLAANPSAAWLGIMLLALSPLVYAWRYLERHSSEIPEHFPVHWNTHGVADGYVPRSEWAIAMPLIIGAAVIVF